jgi:RNA polymerase sigma-54 factor
LVLREVAEDIQVHESTVSRATANKWAATPHGTFELKWFFQSAASTVTGDVASESVKAKIRELIGKEDKRQPYSDHDIVAFLAGHSIEIARRTVAKYREGMGILSSSKRRQPYA